MGDIAVRAASLSKEYRVPVRQGGIKASLASLFRRTYRTVTAVRDVSFSLHHGEIVGFLGPNGAGKTTTLKMLSGLLHPTSGEASVLGFAPWRRESDYLRRMTLVMGQKNQLIWDIPAMDTFLMNKAIYGVSDREFKRTLDEFTELLELEGLYEKPVRNLSLGERMKCELVAALLHKPQVLFLDEPTLGLDVTMQSRIRRFIEAYNARYDACVLLTSHYMADIAALCRRVVMIHHGRIMYDGALTGLIDRMAPFKVLNVALSAPVSQDAARAHGTIISLEEGKLQLQVPREETPRVTARLLHELPVIDLTVEDPPIEDVIERVFQEGVSES